MLIGDMRRFGIEARVEDQTGGWILGRFRFWLGGEALGDWEDWADLRGCVRWLRDFEKNPRERFDRRLDGLDAQGVFEAVFDPVFGSNAFANPCDQPVPNSFARFHISYIGMSSFDQYDVLLLKTNDDRERCLWRPGAEGRIGEIVLDAGEMEDVARRFCDAFDSAFPASPAT